MTYFLSYFVFLVFMSRVYSCIACWFLIDGAFTYLHGPRPLVVRNLYRSPSHPTPRKINQVWVVLKNLSQTPRVYKRIMYIYVSDTSTLSIPLALLSMSPFFTLGCSLICDIYLTYHFDFMLILCNPIFHGKGNVRSQTFTIIPGNFS